MDIMLQRILSLIPDRHGADAEFARSLGYKSGNVVADWRAGRSGSYRGKLREIAEKYNVTVDWLCGNSPQIEKPALPAEDGLGGESLGALLARLTENLVENALKYGKPEGHVWVTVKSQGEEGILEVRDDGIGIPKDQQEKIWQRFYQVDPSRSDESNGVGLGLSMVRQIAQLHGGTVTLDSVEGIGSAFALHLPLWKEEA